ncbi:hypothetical protein JCM11491_004377 [Sporobolomyces phaffii]
MGGLSQTRTAKYLKRAQTDQEVEEILGAYAHAKQAKARHPAIVERKLVLLRCYLNAVGQQDQVIQHARAFSTTSNYASNAIPASNLVFPSTPLGIEIWSEATKESTSWYRPSGSKRDRSASPSLSNFSV